MRDLWALVALGLAAGVLVSRRLFVPALPKSVNEWGWSSHWGDRHRERDRWRELVGVALVPVRRELRRAGTDLLAERGPASVDITFLLPDRRRRDASNGVKLLLDALVHHGLLRDDGPPWLVEETYRCRLAPSPDRVGVVVQITPEGAPAWPLPVRGRARRSPTQGSGPPEIVDPGAS